jgi:hypothetical protein
MEVYLQPTRTPIPSRRGAELGKGEYLCFPCEVTDYYAIQ